jgi:hypothetical protein
MEHRGAKRSECAALHWVPTMVLGKWQLGAGSCSHCFAGNVSAELRFKMIRPKGAIFFKKTWQANWNCAESLESVSFSPQYKESSFFPCRIFPDSLKAYK